MEDLYFELNYGRLYEDIEGGRCEVFEFQGTYGTVKHLFIKRLIPARLIDSPYYDLVTPYGYGGPVITECKEDKKAELVQEFIAAFQEYCKENRVVSEFIRFHPVFGNAHDFKDCYEVIYKRNTIQTNLADSEDPILCEYSASCRRDIRQALKAGVEYSIILSPSDLNDFKELYYQTMARNDADSVYYFDDSYFSKCIELFGNSLVVVEIKFQGKVIGMSLNFISGKIIHAHLTGTLKEFHHLAPAYVLQYALALWGKENGIDLIHHGGGRTGDPNDKLYLFKKKFGRNKELEYYYGRKIWNEEVYEKLCQAAGIKRETAVFPAYREKVPVEAK